jgi:mono/diheme cytochrome c family protein
VEEAIKKQKQLLKLLQHPATETPAADATSYDPKSGEGKFDEENVKVDATLNASMADAGEKAAGVKCTSCHKMSEERLVGPGWKGVTQRKSPFWIMNFITNPDPMIDKDPELTGSIGTLSRAYAQSKPCRRRSQKYSGIYA